MTIEKQIATVAELESLRRRLFALTEHWNEHQPLPSTAAQQARSIGTRLGWISVDAMAIAFLDAHAANRFSGYALNNLWDGIAGWKAGDA